MRRDILNVVGLVAAVLVLAVGGPVIVQQLRMLPQGSLAARANERIVTLEVGGMTCSGCASSVQARLAGITGVSTAAVTAAWAERGLLPVAWEKIRCHSLV